MKIKSLLKAILICLIYLIATSFQSPKLLKGTWEYLGGIHNGHPVPPPAGIKLERVYTENQYEGFIVQKNGEKIRYNAGKYTIVNNIYKETQTFSNQPTLLTGKTVDYTYAIRNNKVTFKGQWYGKYPMEDSWKKINWKRLQLDPVFSH